LTRGETPSFRSLLTPLRAPVGREVDYLTPRPILTARNVPPTLSAIAPTEYLLHALRLIFAYVAGQRISGVHQTHSSLHLRRREGCGPVTE
jgi:hypothetical protein